MKDATCVFLDLPESKKLTTIECETSLIILTQVKKLLLDAESKHYSDVGLKYSKDFIARIVVKMLPMMGRNWNLRGYSLILYMKREGSNVRLGKVTFDFSKNTTHEFILTLKEQPTPRWHYYVPGFFKFMLQGPVILSPDFEIRKRTLLNFEY